MPNDGEIKNTNKSLLDTFCKQLGYSFTQSDLLREALTHRSYSASHNERLEFLGDAILNCAITGLIYKCFPDLPEGHLSRLRANFVNQQALSNLALSLQMDKIIRLGEGELKSGGCHRPSILADAFEAVVGAIYLDSDYAQAEAVIRALYLPMMESIDPKTHSTVNFCLCALPMVVTTAYSGNANFWLWRNSCNKVLGSLACVLGSMLSIIGK